MLRFAALHRRILVAISCMPSGVHMRRSQEKEVGTVLAGLVFHSRTAQNLSGSGLNTDRRAWEFLVLEVGAHGFR